MTRRGRLALVAVLLAASVSCTLAATFLSWLEIPTATAGTTVVDGVGGITGDTQLAGENLNDVLTGLGSFRPGWISLAVGAATALVALVLLAARPQRRGPLRVTAGLFTLFGLLGGGWAVLRLADPDPAALLGSGSGTAGAGPWVSLVGAVLLLGAAGVLWAGGLDGPEPGGADRHRGIQPRR